MSKPKTRRNKKIRELYQKGVSFYYIGKIFSLNPKTVKEIVKGYKKKAPK